MKSLKYFVVALLAFSAFSCDDEAILRTVDEDDDPIVIPPPRNNTEPADTVNFPG